MPVSAASPTRCEQPGGALLVTADHGNCELMRDPATGGPHTAHTTNPVPVLLIGRRGARRCGRRLADVAPTLLALMGLPQPAEMTGASLLDDAVAAEPVAECAALRRPTQPTQPARFC